MTTKERDELERLRAENAKLREETQRKLTLRVSQKGAVSVYGVGRFPVTLYAEQWEAVLGIADQIERFIAEHRPHLHRKAS